MNLENIQFQSIVSELTNLLNMCNQHISPEGSIQVTHYLNHDEIELAFEILFLELMEVNFSPRVIDVKKWLQIGVDLGLNEDSIIDPDFWMKFRKYLVPS